MAFNAVSFGLLTSDVVGFTPDQRTAVELQATFSVSDEGSAQSKNFRYPRYENFYGYCQIMSGAYVVRSVSLRNLNQELLHWRDETFGINETTGCYAKGLASALNPPFALVTNTVKTRQRYTSLRFKLLPTVRANLGLVWETAEAKCGGNVAEPDNRQGKPLPPNNANSDPGSRPSEQSGDPEDRSPNDGEGPNYPDLPPPPSPGGGTSFPSWHYIGTATGLPGCFTRNIKGDYPAANNPAIQPIYVPTGQNGPCPQATNGVVMYGDAQIDDPGGILSISFYYG